MTTNPASGNHQPLPPRLAEGTGPAGDLLRRHLRGGSPLDEAESWDHLLGRLSRGQARRPMQIGIALAAGAVAGALALFLISPAPDPRAAAKSEPRQPVQVAVGVGVGDPAPKIADADADADADEKKKPRVIGARSKRPAAPAAPTLGDAGAGPRRVRLTAVPSALPQGAVVELGDEARATVSADAAALAFGTDDGAVVELHAGQVELGVQKQAAGRRFRVVAGPYQFTALGTLFSVRRDAAGVELRVDEGRVAVDRGTRRIAIIAGGGSWRDARVPVATGVVTAPAPRPNGGQPIAAATPAAPRPAPITKPAAPATPTTDVPALGPAAPDSSSPACAARARADARDGVACFLQRADAGGAGAQIALYEVARLRRDRLDDAAGALETFVEHRRRFPAGALHTEVDLSIVELLPKLGRYREALDESAALLARGGAGGERPGNLHFLRGNVYREALGDFRHAELEYARAAESGGRSADAAAFWRAVCLETLGRRAEAAAAYRAYLASPSGLARPSDHHDAARAAEAARRLRALGGEHSSRAPL